MVLHYKNLPLVEPNQPQAEQGCFRARSAAMSVWAQHMPVETTTNMQHSNIKDRKRWAVKRAPKVKANTRAAKPKVFIRRNLPQRLAEEGSRFPPKKENQDLKTCISAARTKALGGFVPQVMLNHAVVWVALGVGGITEHSLLQSGLCAKVQLIWSSLKV